MAAKCDHLSLSPSLYNILCLVDRSDITRCKVVNRRLYDVIRLHPQSFIQHSIAIGIITKVKDGQMIVRVHVEDRIKNAASFLACLTTDTIRVFKNTIRVKMDRYKQVNGYSSAPLDLPIESIFGELRYLFTAFFTNWAFSSLDMTASTPQKLLHILIDVMRECGPRTIPMPKICIRAEEAWPMMELRMSWKGLGQLSQLVGGHEQAITLIGFSTMDLVKGHFAWESQKVNLFGYKQPQREVVNFVTEWVNGAHRVLLVRVRAKPGPNWKLHLLKDDLEEALPMAIISHKATTISDKLHLGIFVNRDDNVTLCLSFSPKSSDLFLYDFVDDGEMNYTVDLSRIQ